MRRTLLTLVLISLSTASIWSTQFTPAQAADTTKAPAPAIYDTTANTQTQIADALKLAKETDKNVLIQWGANWCVWCRALHHLLTTDSSLAAELDSNYVWILADVGRKNKNGDLLEKYGVDQKQGIPFLTVLSADGKVLTNQETGALETKDKENKGHNPDKVMAFLQAHAPKK